MAADSGETPHLNVYPEAAAASGGVPEQSPPEQSPPDEPGSED
jgi:hypothetical protein